MIGNLAFTLLLLLPTSPAGVDRESLAASFLRFEDAMANSQLDAETFEQADVDFDKLSAFFLMGRLDIALEMLDELRADVVLGRPRTDQEKALDSIVLNLSPWVFVPESGAEITLEMESAYLPELDDVVGLDGKIIVEDSAGKEVQSTPFELSVEDGYDVDERLNLDLTSLQPGTYHVSFKNKNGSSTRTRRLMIAETSLVDVRRTNEQLLDEVEASLENQSGKKSDNLLKAIEVCRARNNLIMDRPLATSSIHVVQPPTEIADAVATEISALAKGEDPYQEQTGDHWRTVRVGSKEIPMRVFAPEKRGRSRLPLVIALHGAGGDENMFSYAYGKGSLIELAQKKKFLVAAPLTYAVMSNPKVLDAVIEEVKSDFAVDPKRIYVLGHSLGGGTAAKLAQSRSGDLAAVCCLAGVSAFQPGSKMAPTLVITGDRDSIVPVQFVRAPVMAAELAGLPVELDVRENRGHSLFVPEILPDAIDWLLEHRASSR